MSNRVLGCDTGTMFCQVAEKDKEGKIKFKTMRNAFVELENYDTEDIEEILKQNKWQYVTDDIHYYVIGEDSLKCSLIFPDIKLRRPMQDGVLNKEENKKMLVMAKIVELLIEGKATGGNSLICFCTSGESVDNKVDDKFHSARLTSMFERFGWKTKRISEGLAVILSERPVMTETDGTEVPYTGLGLSFGAGKINASLAYKGLEIISMSITRAGDYIDQMVLENTDSSLAKITHTKENKLNFLQVDYDDDIIFCLDIYYNAVLKYLFHNLNKKFAKVKSQFSGPIDIVIAGGTASPPGFDKKVESVIKNLDLPFEVKEIKISSDPRNSVVKGLLIQAIISQKKLENRDIDEMFE